MNFSRRFSLHQHPLCQSGPVTLFFILFQTVSYLSLILFLANVQTNIEEWIQTLIVSDL